jgi:hypothetical protein
MMGESMSELSRRVEKLWQARFYLVEVPGYALLLYGATLLFAQTVSYLKTNKWVEIPAIYLFISPERIHPSLTEEEISILSYVPKLSRESEWLIHPNSWYGLHKIALNWLNSLSVPMAAILVGSFWVWAMEEDRKSASKRPDSG